MYTSPRFRKLTEREFFASAGENLSVICSTEERSNGAASSGHAIAIAAFGALRFR